jgi:8-oxo-dGTP diphosphatase
MPERILATLCYVIQNDRVLMLLRNKEPNKGLWIAPGGKLEFDESPQECALRELAEETGLQGHHPQLRGIITEVSPRDDYQWLIFIFVVHQVTGDLTNCELLDCPEGRLAWVPIAQVPDLELPAADTIFFPHIIGPGPLFRAKFVYDRDLGIVSWEHYSDPISVSHGAD